MSAIMAIPEAFLKKQGVRNPKAIIYGAGIILLLLVIFTIIRKIRQGKGGKYTSDILDDEVSSGTLTISSGEATIIAQNLLNAMNRWGTDENAILDNLSKAKTYDDLVLITQKFGIKPYDGTRLADTFLNRQIAGVMKNLSGWIRSELSGADLRKAKEIYDNLGVPF